MSTATENKPVKIGQLPIVKDNILKNAREMDKGIAGGYSGAFPLSSATKDGIYLVPQTGKFYVCETAYDGNQITLPNSNFVELSLWKNHNSLANLEGIKSEYVPYGDATIGFIKIGKLLYITFNNVSISGDINFKNIPIWFNELLSIRSCGALAANSGAVCEVIVVKGLIQLFASSSRNDSFSGCVFINF